MLRIINGRTKGARRVAGAFGAALAATLLAGCTVSVPEGISPVRGFEVERYAGRWYEIARFDFVFERGLDNVTATYELNADGTVRVINRGYEEGTCRLREREGRAEFTGPMDVASLAVSFFGPFAGGYHVFILDENYRYAVVTGSDRGFLWILSRTPEMDQRTLDRILSQAAAAGFDVSQLVFVDQTGPNC